MKEQGLVFSVLPRTTNLSEALSILLPEGEKHRSLLRKMKEALCRDDREAVLLVARQICGMCEVTEHA